MISTSNLKSELFPLIQNTASQQGCSCYLYGDYANFLLKNENHFIKDNLVKLIICGTSFSNQSFYEELSKNITINKEFENNENKYCFFSNGYIFDLMISKNSICNSLPGNFNVEKLAVNLQNFSFVDCGELKDIQNSIVVIKNINNYSKWDMSDIFGFATLFASYSKSQIDTENLSFIKSKNIKNYPISNKKTNSELLLDMLLTYRPGSAIKLIESIPGGREFLFELLIDFSIKNDIHLSEDISIKEIFSKNRLDLLDLYNDFFLSEIIKPELPKERTNRITTTLKLLFDSPSLNIETPYIDSVSLMSSSVSDDSEKIDLFNTDECMYGICPDCKPEDCNPQCCCCHSVDIVSAANMRCHKRTVLSCNSDGTGYGNEDGQLFVDCPDCNSACQTILGLRDDLEDEGCQNFTSIGQSEGWWTIPATNWPCDCNCAQQSAGTCNLTCVTCRDIYCDSIATVTGNDCNYNISLTPGDNCCGPEPVEEIVFVIHATQPVTFGGSPTTGINIKALTIEAINRIASVNSHTRFGLVTFDDSLSSDTTGTRYVATLTNADNLIGQIPNTLFSGERNDTPVGSHWYAGIRAITETEWTSGSNRRVVFVFGKDFYVQEISGTLPEICNFDDDTGLGKCFSTYISLSLSNNIRLGMALHSTTSIDDSQLSVISEKINGFAQCGTSYSSSDDSVDNFFLGDTAFYECVQPSSGFSSSCDCINTTPIPIRQDLPICKCCKNGETDPCVDDPLDVECIQNLPETCFNIPIIKCLPGEDCNCDLPTAINICGNTVLIQPTRKNLICCSELGFGCECDVSGSSNPVECCGPQCYDICTMYEQNPDINGIVDFIWSDCWTKKSGIDMASTPHCTDPCCPDPTDPKSSRYPCELKEPGSTDPCCPCLLENQDDCCNCCIKFLDETGQPSITYCRSDIEQQVRQALESCASGGSGGGDGSDGSGDSGTGQPPPPWDPPNKICRVDKCIVGQPDLSKNTIDEQCDNKNLGCVSVKNPSTVVLNNGIGLVAYESNDNISSIKIQQFNTSLGNKLLPNREFNFGRLQHQNSWQNGIAKLYVYDSVSEHLLNGTDSPLDQTSWKDVIGFKNGPLEKQFFPIINPPYSKDSVGNFVQFYVGTSPSLTNSFKSSDDVYNIKFFIFDSEDTGVIGDSTDTATDGSKFDIQNRSVVDEALLLPQHIYNGNPVPVAFPSLSTAANYSNSDENSQFVFLAYQALEDTKWNIYVRQIRLSEYEREEQLDDAILNNEIVSLDSLGIGNVIYRIVCINDNCTESGSSFLSSRNIVFEVILTDGRDVLNPGLTGQWPSLCSGHSSAEFPREKVFVQFSHTVSSDRCPNHEEFNDIFYNWFVGQEFLIPAAKISANGLFSLLKISDDTSVSIGDFDVPISVSGVSITNSSVSAIWYQNIDESTWSVISGKSYDTLQTFKGLDIGEPVLITANDSGHCTRPVIKVNYNNDIFIVYESTETGISQIKLCGTSSPHSALPLGIFHAKNLDSTLRYFISSSDFIYNNSITLSSDGINNNPDMFIDLNNVIHLTWQSNKDKRWEIYYANSENNFSIKRITNHSGRSFKPSIDGDNSGKVFIAWHDDRFGNGYEIMMAYYPGVRILPLYQQDPYLAGIRNSGYQHYVDELTFSLTNELQNTICANEVVVDFYTDRTLEKLAFSIKQSDCPFAFKITGSENDSFTQSYDNFFIDWTDDPYENIIVSNEFDTGLSGSIVTNFIIDFKVFDNEYNAVEISFRGSDTPNDPIGQGQWSSWISLSKGGSYYYSQFSTDNVSGRYKQVRLRTNYKSTEPELNSLSVKSESLHRVCLTTGQTVFGTLDLTPEIRIDSAGNNTQEMPITVALNSNVAYFVKVRILNDDGIYIDMPDQKSSVSCESCLNKITTWNFESCSVKTILTNLNSEIYFYNLRITFYYDQEKTRKISQFYLFPSSEDLSFATVDSEDARDFWSSRGLSVKPNSSKSVVIWPDLSPTSGLLCGIKYYVDVEVCSVSESSVTDCTESDLKIQNSISWICNCKSIRWDPELEDSPVNLLEMKRWHSSGDGLSDTRLTETINTNNLNPIIKMRSNLNGIVLYQTNRPESANDSAYKIYASIFSILPSSNMYASGAQAINSPFSSIIYRSDVPICANSDSSKIGCYDSNNQRINDTIRGENPSLSLDQYDNLFLATEIPFENNGCQDFKKDKQRYISVHTCGSDSLDLFVSNDQILSNETDNCELDSILKSSFYEKDFISRKTKVLIRVVKDFVDYNITKNGITIPVISKCNIKLEVIGSTDTISIRIKNSEDKNYSEWKLIDPKFNLESTIIDWKTSNGNGLHVIQFQCATINGLSQTGILNIICDYDKVSYKLNIYKPLSSTPFPPETVDIKNNDIWKDSNKVLLFNGLDVASLRPPISVSENVLFPESDYVFIEIEPNPIYMKQFSEISDETKSSGLSGIEPVFDFIQQGEQNIYGITTIWARNDKGNEVFRGLININKDNTTFYKDGLASILIHFKNDCSDIGSLEGSEKTNYIKDIFNLTSNTSDSTNSQFILERDDNGRLLYKLTIRPNEDPYFAFGDPNYRIKE